jgi:histidinol phosphatase-like enzyme
MSIAKPLKKAVAAVILDLDGTLIHTGQFQQLDSFSAFTFINISLSYL